MLMADKKLIEYLESEGYENIRELSDGRIICTFDFLFTRAIIVDATWDGYGDRYCYPDREEAAREIRKWDGKGDPGGNWKVKK